MENKMKNYADINYLTPADCEFYETEGGLLGLKARGEDLGRVALVRMFPLRQPDRFISVRKEIRGRSDSRKEYGVIEDLSAFGGAQRELIDKELARRYFVPEVTKVVKVKEEYGHSYWETETTAGNRNFTVFDLNSNLLNLGNNRVMIIDVDGNRYIFPDVTKVGEKALRLLEIWL
ncbi:MAG: DUF1854 domain-containing protein [Clostridia bacterium]